MQLTRSLQLAIEIERAVILGITLTIALSRRPLRLYPCSCRTIKRACMKRTRRKLLPLQRKSWTSNPKRKLSSHDALKTRVPKTYLPLSPPFASSQHCSSTATSNSLRKPRSENSTKHSPRNSLSSNIAPLPRAAKSPAKNPNNRRPCNNGASKNSKQS